jgi:hypothetical protein
VTDDADFPDFKAAIEQWRIEYGRIRRLGGGDYWAGCRLEEAVARSKMSPYALGVADRRALREAMEMHEPPYTPSVCLFADGTSEKAEYDRGWDALPLRP